MSGRLIAGFFLTKFYKNSGQIFQKTHENSQQLTKNCKNAVILTEIVKKINFSKKLVTFSSKTKQNFQKVSYKKQKKLKIRK